MRMKSEAKTAIALFGSAAILVLAVGCGDKVLSSTTATMPVSLSAAAHGDPPSGCIHKANC